MGTGTNTFSLVDPNGSGNALDAYVKATAPGHVDTYLYPPYAIYEDFTNALFLMFGDDLWSLVPLVGGVTQADGNGAILMIVVDCDNEPVGGATISIQPNVGAIRYADNNSLPSSSATGTNSEGFAFIFDLPPGDYVVDAERGGVSLHEHTVGVVANSATTTIIVP